MAPIPSLQDLLVQTLLSWCKETLVFRHSIHVQGLLSIKRDGELALVEIDNWIHHNDEEGRPPADSKGSPRQGSCKKKIHSRGNWSSKKLSQKENRMKGDISTSGRTKTTKSPVQCPPQSATSQDSTLGTCSDSEAGREVMDDHSPSGGQDRSADSEMSDSAKLYKDKVPTVSHKAQGVSEVDIEQNKDEEHTCKHVDLHHKQVGKRCQQDASPHENDLKGSSNHFLLQRPDLDDINPEMEKSKLDKDDISGLHAEQFERSNLPGQDYATCKMCQKVFISNTVLQRHMKTVHQRVQELYKCKFCEKPFARACAVTNHEKIHTGVTPFKCQHCEHEFETKNALENHELLHVNAGVKAQVSRYVCSYCSRTFKSRSVFKRHLRIHTGDRPYKCRYCSKRFNQMPNCTIHERVHTGERPYQCMYCGKAFATNHKLKNHENTHIGERSHKCPFCERTFTTARDKCVHERTHTGEKPFSCQYCGKTFSDLSNMKVHERIHTGVKPYSCNLCQQGFNRKSHLVNHSSHCHQTYSGFPANLPDFNMYIPQTLLEPSSDLPLGY
ncbi:zinc finger protein 70-like [Lingula anatina]|uniref:Zinc finger protein 70-like n=1 Tax=Lingula anatina TaxID=7574 RepID=A0A1S3I795_LINAN|nr:zinc finger protein 70-like [Lingula anatina]XP_013394074.1 zinc finger protein 70-like [Lingula anatina]|eukprot:XP_013394073.1 zinc finger protein 70-like [Lingula anatina]